MDKYLPSLETALKEYGFVEPFAVAQILAEIAYETDGFTTLVGYTSGQAYEVRTDLGNTEPGDGLRFRARGLLGFPTGRVNYANLSRQLGFGSRFVESPEDVLIPDIATRIACFYFKGLGQRFREAVKQNDVVAVRRMVSGGLNGLDIVRSYYQLFLPMLMPNSGNTVK